MTPVACPRPDKIGYPTHAMAARALGVLRGRKGFGVAEIYRCDCGLWHLGRSGPGVGGKSRRRKRTQRRRLKRSLWWGKGDASQ